MTTSRTQTSTPAQDLPVEFRITDEWLCSVDFEKKDANEARAMNKDLDPCFRCGRGVKPDSGWRITVIHGGGAVQRADVEPDTSDNGFMGSYAVGSECGKYFPMAYRVKNTPWEPQA